MTKLPYREPRIIRNEFCQARSDGVDTYQVFLEQQATGQLREGNIEVLVPITERERSLGSGERFSAHIGQDCGGAASHRRAFVVAKAFQGFIKLCVAIVSYAAPVIEKES